MVLGQGVVEWLGPDDEAPVDEASETIDAGGRLLTPGLVEGHTFVLDAGAPSRDLLTSAARLVTVFSGQGVTTIEVKAGQGTSTEDQLQFLRLARQLDGLVPIRVRVTLLVGPTYPPGVDREAWLAAVCEELIPTADEEGLMDQVEVCLDEDLGFGFDDSSTILEAAYCRKIPTRLQADQYRDSAGGALASSFYARAAVHLNHTDEVGITTMAQSGTTAVLVPLIHRPQAGRPVPPVETMRARGLSLAVSTGADPWAGPRPDLGAAARQAVSAFGLTEAEAWAGITSAAARALDLHDGTGSLQVGGRADLALWEAAHPHDLLHPGTTNRLVASWSAGHRIRLPPTQP